MESIEEYRHFFFFFTLISSLFQFIETEVINRQIAKASCIYIYSFSLFFSVRAKEKVFNSIAARHVGTQVCGRRLSRIDYRAHQRDSRCIIGEAPSSPFLPRRKLPRCRRSLRTIAGTAYPCFASADNRSLINRRLVRRSGKQLSGRGCTHAYPPMCMYFYQAFLCRFLKYIYIL